MRNQKWQSSWTSFAIAALVVCFTTTAQADWSDDFNGGALNPNWVFGSDGGDPDTFLDGQIIDNQLVLTADTTPGDGGVQSGFGIRVDGFFEDVFMTGVVNPGEDSNINDSVGLMARANTLTQSFYFAELNYNAGELIIYRNNPGVEGGNSNVAIEPIDVTFSDSVYLEFELIGSQINLWAYEDETKANELASVSFDDTSDAALVSGLTGVFVNENFSALPMLGVWDDLTATAIITTPPGDIDGDGDVDGTDFLLIQRGFGDTTSQQDLDDWLANYPTPMPLGASAIPEPSTLCLSIGMMLLGGIRRRRS